MISKFLNDAADASDDDAQRAAEDRQAVTLPDGSVWDGETCLTEGGATLDELNERAHGKPDPRDPDPCRPGIFRDHNCWKCRNGTDLSRCPTPQTPGNCGFPHARND